MPEPLLAVSALHAGYGSTEILRGVDLAVGEGEIVAVKFRQHDVLVASICDPGVGFSLVGRRRCTENRERVRLAVSAGKTATV